MNTLEYTKGEWKVGKNLLGEPAVYVDDKEQPHGKLLICKTFILGVKEVDENAKLIAKAPKMYESLKEIKSQLIDRGFSEDSPMIAGITELLTD